jgi:hypothetical protein
MNSIVTILGEVCFNRVSGVLEMKKPEYFLKDKSLLIHSLNQKLMTRKIVQILLYIPFIISVALFIK